MKAVHYYRFDGVIWGYPKLRLCATCRNLTAYVCVSCQLPMCLGCLDHHPRATYAPHGDDFPPTVPRRVTPYQLTISALALLITCSIIGVIVELAYMR